MLQRAGHDLVGADLLIDSDVPIGAGLSSSAALEIAAGFALLELRRDRGRPHADSALTCQRAENEFVGMRCGMMDQFISCHGAAAHALLLDCRSLAFRLVPIAAIGSAGGLQLDGASRASRAANTTCAARSASAAWRCWRGCCPASARCAT